MITGTSICSCSQSAYLHRNRGVYHGHDIEDFGVSTRSLLLVTDVTVMNVDIIPDLLCRQYLLRRLWPFVASFTYFSSQLFAMPFDHIHRANQRPQLIDGVGHLDDLNIMERNTCLPAEVGVSFYC
jgi:hypothetical protein